MENADKIRSVIDLTVAIPTYNGEKRIGLVLEKLLTQKTGADIRWEVVVVDNNSSDGTGLKVREFQSRWRADVPLKYLFQPVQGLGPSRMAAVMSAEGECVGFLDDDNLPDPNWVQKAVEFGKRYPQAGVWNGRSLPSYEEEPPAGIDRIAAFLALMDRGPVPAKYDPKYRVLPPGAGIIARKKAWIENVPRELSLKGRTDDFMLGGEDIEAVLYIQNAGWEVWYNPEMVFYHVVPKERFSKEYLIPVFRGIGLSRYATRCVRMKNYPVWKRRAVLTGHFIYDIYKLIRHTLKYGRKIDTDVVAASEHTMLVNSVTSPLFFTNRILWKKLFYRQVTS